MEREEVKKAVDLAEKEIRDKQIEQVKELVKRTLLKLDEVDKKIKDLQEERKILKLDIDNLKAGRLDLIEERQQKDKKAKETSVATIVKEKVVEHHYHNWYYPYRVYWYEPIPTFTIASPIYCGGTTTSNNAMSLSSTTAGNYFTGNSLGGNSYMCSINGSIAKDYTAGAYDVNGKVINLS